MARAAAAVSGPGPLLQSLRTGPPLNPETASFSTIPELLERHYEKKGAILAVACQIVIQLVITSLQYVAGGSILHTVLPEYFSLQTG